MEPKHIDDLIAVNEFCVNHSIEISFINLLQQNGLIEISTIESKYYVEKEKLTNLEKFVRYKTKYVMNYLYEVPGWNRWVILLIVTFALIGTRFYNQNVL